MSLLELAGPSGLARTGQPNNQEQLRLRCHDPESPSGYLNRHVIPSYVAIEI
jgi:hypothetical protein